MKLIHMLPPVVALVVVGTWLGLQRRAISTTRQDCVMLREQLAAASLAGTGADPARAKPAGSHPHGKDKGPLNWRTLAGQFKESQRGIPADMRVMMRFEKRLREMNREELIAGLEELATLELPVNSRSMLEQMLIGPLIEKDPEYALSRFIDGLQDEQSGIKWHLPNALREWAKQDPAKAGTWLDQQIAAGKFASKTLDGRSQFRTQFESVMSGVLFPSDSDAAGRRLAALPDAQRGEVANSLLGSLKEENLAAFIQLVRAQLPAKEQSQIFAQQAGQWISQGGYPKVTEYLERIGASPAERGACVEQAAFAKFASANKQVTREDVDALRAWAATQAPTVTDRVTGNILATATQITPKLEFNAAAELAVQYSQASGNDDVLGTFLESWTARNNKELARIFAEKIADESRRAAILKRLQ